MEYSQEQINQIKEIIKKDGYAKTNLEPAFYLISTFLVFGGILIMINRTNGRINLALLVILLALVILRLFIIFHDLCHQSYFPTDERTNKKDGLNINLACIMEPIFTYPAKHWKKIHSEHHRAQGNLSIPDGTRSLYTKKQYDELKDWEKILYDIIRYPPIFFLVAPLYVYWIARIVDGHWIFLLKYGIWLYFLYYFGKMKLVFAFMAGQYLAGLIGIMLFHWQHQFNPGYWKEFDESDKLSKDNAELLGSSVQTIPELLKYFTNGIEYHNIHHIDPGMPSYNIRYVHEKLTALGLLNSTVLNYKDMWNSLGFTIYDNDAGIYK